MTSPPIEDHNRHTTPPHDGIEFVIFKLGSYTLSLKASFRTFALLIFGGIAFAGLYLLAVKTGAM